LNTAARVRFLNHSCLSVSSGATTILCDPWFTGAAFDNGWRLLAENSHDLGDQAYDYIWLSHEHPDHFSIATLRQIREPARFIYQRTADGKVKDYLSRTHQVCELADCERRAFGDIDSQLYLSDGYDSAMLFRLPGGRTILNLNDCRAELGGLAERIAAEVEQVDLLAVQFSYANWAGNPGDAAIPAYQHDQVVARLERTIEVFRPKAVLLFASYVYFSHEENFFWNQHFWLQQVVDRLGGRVKLIVPKPDDVIELDGIETADFSARNAAAISFWTDLHDTRVVADRATGAQSLEALREQFQAFHAAMWRDNDLAHAGATSRGPLELTVRIGDLDQTVKLELFSGAMSEAADGEPDVDLSSETLAMLFKSRFGRGTLTINGRVQFNYPTAHRFFGFFFVFYANNIGRRLKPGDLSWADMRSIAKTAVLDSIFQTTPGARAACEAYLDGFIAA